MKSRKSVTFSETSTMVMVSNLSSSLYKQSLWFTQSDLDLFEADNIRHVNAVRSIVSSRHRPGAEDILGVEKFLSLELTQEYKVRRLRLKRAVLEEARWQRWRRVSGIPTCDDNDMD
eukprot:CAMPEP_0172543596 /NCGR_PEP_ID=MMETSP1067-20121228/13944_1 /TAXON_ID=265564 ORGANISM="Thalassiosira punctigera, Strain Tpunct2005C2" /NCGR_SAMPLE_ID=MMETSP1067 /ASSEMBLY_ACC=CAM_ASM_000444 /LENGTH=116 /DNA_ID=CAMNT_0013330037 /DNA_START=50 /DNA_END=397 /DNA_ORIENTATION=-